MIQFDHVQVEARDLSRAARLLAELLGCAEPAVEGQDGDMLRIDLDKHSFVLFTRATSPRAVHVAFRVDQTRFAQIVQRLRERNLPFGNEPDAPTNGQLQDALGGNGRIYFNGDDGHLWEVTC